MDSPSWQSIILCSVWLPNVPLHIQVSEHPVYDYSVIGPNSVQHISTKYFLHGFHIHCNFQERNNDVHWGKTVSCFTGHFIMNSLLFQKIIPLTAIPPVGLESSMQHTRIRAAHVCHLLSPHHQEAQAHFFSLTMVWNQETDRWVSGYTSKHL